MDAKAVRQLRMGIEWAFLIRGDIGSYCIISWILSYCRMDRIVLLAGSYRNRLDWIVSYWLDQETLHFMRWLVTSLMGQIGRMDRMGSWWDRGGTDRR